MDVLTSLKAIVTATATCLTSAVSVAVLESQKASVTVKATCLMNAECAEGKAFQKVNVTAMAASLMPVEPVAEMATPVVPILRQITTTRTPVLPLLLGFWFKCQRVLT